MKAMNDEATVEQMRRYEHARRQEDSWKHVREDADKKLKESVSRKYAAMVGKKVKRLCEAHRVSDDRHWWVSGTSVRPSVDHSKSPWVVSAHVKVEVGLYIHEEGEKARDRLEIDFNVEEMDVALARLGRMMAAGAGVGKG